MLQLVYYAALPLGLDLHKTANTTNTTHTTQNNTCTLLRPGEAFCTELTLF